MVELSPHLISPQYKMNVLALLAIVTAWVAVEARLPHHQTNVDNFHAGVPAELKARLRKSKSHRASCATPPTDPGQSHRFTPTKYGGDPTGVRDSTEAVQAALKGCLDQAVQAF